MDLFEKLKPAVNKYWLLAVAGAMWSGVGYMLCHMAYEWLSHVIMWQAFILALAGLLLALTIYRFGFSKLAKKNIQRISDLIGDKICVFAFQGWKSYPLVLIMIALGITLRVYSPIPKPYLAILYIGIGGGLFFSSLHYYWALWLRWRSKHRPQAERSTPS
jgi:ABC-type nitrate/sulfonate/bicarbonate transport system permease component